MCLTRCQHTRRITKRRGVGRCDATRRSVAVDVTPTSRCASRFAARRERYCQPQSSSSESVGGLDDEPSDTSGSERFLAETAFAFAGTGERRWCTLWRSSTRCALASSTRACGLFDVLPARAPTRYACAHRPRAAHPLQPLATEWLRRYHTTLVHYTRICLIWRFFGKSSEHAED